MSWFSNSYSSFISKAGQIISDVNKYNPLVNRYHAGNDVSDFIQKEVVDKSDLRATELESFLSGLPIVGGVIKGVEGINQLEDLYNNTGKTVQYPGLNNGGAAAIGKSVGGLTRKIENGTHDLSEFYSGEKLGPMPVEGEDYVTGDKYVN